MSVAERTRGAVREEPFLLAALGAGVVNYSAAARWLDVDGDEESIATALRRFAAELDAPQRGDRRVSVRLRRNVDPEALDTIPDDVASPADQAAIEVSGDVDAAALEYVLGRLRAAEVAVESATLGDETLVVTVPKRAGADGLRIVEDALGAP